MAGELPKQDYTRAEVRRLLGLTERQLRSWERQELIPAQSTYGFADLLALRTLAKLRQGRVPTAKIREAVTAVRDKLADVENPLVELRIFSERRKVRVQLGHQTIEPASGQLLLNFGADEIRKMVEFPRPEDLPADPAQTQRRRDQADQLFQQALSLEQSGETLAAIASYEKVIAADPSFAGALVNLGTIYFTARDLKKAEDCYQRAVEADRSYALARFNLGNLYDELGKRAEALAQYKEALRLNTNYADAHYNIALLYQASGQTLQAVHHWKTYLKLDPMSPWAAVARRELDKLYRETVVDKPKRPE